MEHALEITEFGTGLRAHLGLDGRADEQHPLEASAVPAPVELEPEAQELDVLAALEAELIEREREVAAREAVLAARGVPSGPDELALARERRRARVDAPVEA